MSRRVNRLIVACVSVLFSVCFSNVQAELSQQQLLGKFLYFDENLSEPAGQSCASCHHPDAGFADPDTNLPVSEGVIPGRFGGRNSPSAAYAVFFPEFSYSNNIAIGGQFWDGRAANLTEQAKGPFLNPVEMNNPNRAAVIADIQVSSYVNLFEEVCGPIVDIDAAYDCTAEAIAAYEGSDELNKFTSKFDLVMVGQARFTHQERRGRMLFNGRALCSQCHLSGGMMGGMGGMGGGGSSDLVLFTDFRYYNLGLPKNTEYPLDQQPANTVDLGLGGVLGVASENGKFKTPHLRNIAMTPPFMHNGLLKTLKEVVHFYNTRDIPGLWNPPEVAANMETRLLGNLGLTSSEEDAIVAFMLTFTDGYTPGGGGSGGGHRHR
ncbi:Cytochrome c551 peroxidase [hydrothermal vent metagenome]|uniref:Cytochrome c551 peroxidase n=1 Tax=hydrothermal vent metagenome TaxID=652676 RepID=A0A3B1A6X5_9ZZZZ